MLYRRELKYFKTHEDNSPLRVISLDDVSGIDRDETAGRPFCIRQVCSTIVLDCLTLYNIIMLVTCDISLSQSCIVQSLPSVFSSSDCSYRLRTSYRTFFLCASSEADASEWKRMLDWKLTNSTVKVYGTLL